MPLPNPFGIRGYLIDAPAFGSLRSHPDGALIVANGKITEAGAYDDLRKRQRPEPIRWIDRSNSVIFPGAPSAAASFDRAAVPEARRSRFCGR